MALEACQMAWQCILAFSCFLVFVSGQINTQNNLNKMAEGLKVTYDVISNTKDVNTFLFEITLQNQAAGVNLDYSTWEIHFDHIFLLEPDHIGMGSNIAAKLPDQFIEVTHVQGSHYSLKPLPGFVTIAPGGMRKIKLKSKYWSAARTDTMPNWYMTSQNLQPRLIASTTGETLSFVTDKNSPSLWKRYNYDLYNPYTTQERYDRNFIENSDDNSEFRVIPKPYRMTLGDGAAGVQLISIDGWTLVYEDGLVNEANYLGGKLRLTPVTAASVSQDRIKTIRLRTDDKAMGSEPGTSNVFNSSGSYTLMANATTQQIVITGLKSAGVFYGAVTMLSLMDNNRRMPECSIKDGPRFEYRGVMLDIARNFHGKDQILQIIQVMGQYKLNKLHLHLSDDEGWRLEITTLPELTQIGAKRCHDPAETRCLMPEIGSGPSEVAPGSGFLTRQDYNEILIEAVRNHVEVIPEFDMPGHARAAIKAMESRMKTLSRRGAVTPNNDVTLAEPGDTSLYTTPQWFSDNAANPCLNSTYNFISKVMDQVIQYHQSLQPLRVYHFGGDEVGKGAWVNSTACKQLVASGQLPGKEVQHLAVKELFFQRVSQLAREKGLDLGVWADGVMEKNNHPFDIDNNSPSYYAYSWNNVWEWGGAPQTYNMANDGYKVILAHGTHLYFDHPYEPGPEERGYYWATRFTDTLKTFSYNAKNVYDNISARRSGQPITDQEKCAGDASVTCPNLTKSDNIVGMQGAVFSETTRTQAQLHDRLFPRVLALAERAWHEAPWESLPMGTERRKMFTEDWSSFVRAVGHRELPRLEAEGVSYRLPPPGAKLCFGRLRTTSLYPGLVVEYSLDMGQSWSVAGPLVFLGDYKHRISLRTRSLDGRRFSRTVVLDPEPMVAVTSQPTIDYIANNVNVMLKIDDNFKTFGDSYYVIKVTMENKGDMTVPQGNWAIYFYNVQWVENKYLYKGLRYVNHDAEMYIEHVKGYLFRMGPTVDFKGLEGKTSLVIDYKASGWSVSRYEQMPRWFVAAPGMQAKDIKNTVGEDMSFVADFSKPNQWKRTEEDKFSPWSPAARYDRNANFAKKATSPSPILPTPMTYTPIKGSVTLTSAPWRVLYGDSILKSVAEYFDETLTSLVDDVSLSISALNSKSPAVANSIRLTLGQVSQKTSGTGASDAYRLKVDPTTRVIEVTSTTAAGVFNGVVSLIQLSHQPKKEGQVTGCEVVDWPRFGYRGMFLDVSRNFQPKEQVMKLLDAMAMYKLNKLHFHLSDDEGWRLEIPGLPELTQVGGRRCFNPGEKECVMSTLGSGVGSDNSGSGFYTVSDYQEILRHAQRRQIEVIPEFDSPGHGHAAIKAMRVRRQRLLDLGEPVEKANEFLLDDIHDPSQYFSVQFYDDNAINPCIESTYRFIEHVVEATTALHKDIQPLKVFHFGGDEVAHGAWEESPACQALRATGTNLKEIFTRRVSALTSNFSLGAWEDGLIDDGKPWKRDEILNKNVLAYTWSNVWEWGGGRRAALFANDGYQVVLSPVTHMYFDHPSEPSPEERGFYWGARYTDIFKAFSFMPENYYDNIDINRMGDKLNVTEICANHGCPDLEKPENVIGLQGQLWTETVRLPSQMDAMIFPRLLALAERAWHRAPWEGKPIKQRKAELVADQARFAQLLGSTHLAVLEKLGVEYRVPPPGARQSGEKIMANTEFPGLRVMYMDKNARRHLLTDKTTFAAYGQDVTLQTVSHDGKRFSAKVKVKMTPPKTSSSSVSCVSSILLVLVLLLSSC